MYLCREPRCFANAITESFGIIKGFGWLAEMLMCSLFSLCASVCTPSKKVMEGSVLSPPHRKDRMDWFAHQIHRIPPSVRRCCCRVGRFSFLLSVTVRMFLTRCDDSHTVLLVSCHVHTSCSGGILRRSSPEGEGQARPRRSRPARPRRAVRTSGRDPVKAPALPGTMVRTHAVLPTPFTFYCRSRSLS